MSIKILVTLGPKSMKEDIIKECDKFDIFVYRINLSHTEIGDLRKTIDTIRRYTDTPICLDSEGAQIRTRNMKGGEVCFQKDATVRIHNDNFEGDIKNISLTPEFVAKNLCVGDILDLDFHTAKLEVVKVDEDGCDVIVLSSGMVGSNKAADLNREIILPPITQKDEKALEIGREMGIKHFALSFADSKKNVDLFRDKTGQNSYIISKVESRPGIRNLSEILESSNAILIDRGDLSRQVPIEKIPFFQRRIISTARSFDKEVFVATNLLESMVTMASPTRAEVNDIVSTQLMGAHGLVLAAETAIGQYPVECVEMIRKVSKQCERWTPNTSMNELLSDTDSQL
jgi:pyruvate kinase